MRRRTSLCIVLAAVAAPCAAFSDPVSAPPAAVSATPAPEPFDGVARQIEQIESTQGANSPSLVKPLTSLGMIFREREDAELARAAFERARHLVRVNYGLSSFEEAPLLRQLLQLERANGNATAAWDLERELVSLIYRHPGPRAAPMLREIADTRADVLSRYAAGSIPPEIMLGCYYAARVGKNRSCPHAGSRSRVKTALQNEAWSYYTDAIAMAEPSGEMDAAIPEIHLAMVRILYAFPDSDTTEQVGRQILADLHARAVASSEPLPTQVDALVRLADWNLLFATGREEKQAALEAYEALYAELEQQRFDEASIDAIFSPSAPFVLPAFLPSPLASAEIPGSSGYIDVAFDITKYGESRSIEILPTSTHTASAARSRLYDRIAFHHFRPQAPRGAFEERSRVVMRYYVND